MNPLINALKQIVYFLDNSEYQYMIIGGLANGIYGQSRQTFDIDVKIILSDENLPEFLNKISHSGKVLPEDPIQFVKETGVIPVDLNGVRIDFILANLDFEKEAIIRSKHRDISGIKAPVTTAEDLIIQKCISVRDRDWMDIRGIIINQNKNLDWDYLLKHVKDFSEFLSNPEILAKINLYRDEIDI